MHAPSQFAAHALVLVFSQLIRRISIYTCYISQPIGDYLGPRDFPSVPSKPWRREYGILFSRKMGLKSLVSHTIAMYPRPFHTSMGIQSGPIALPPFILFKASFNSDSWMRRTKRMLVSSKESFSLMVELSFSPLNSLSRYSRHLLNLLVLHQELVYSVLDAFDLVNIPCLPLSDLGHLIDVAFPFLRV